MSSILPLDLNVINVQANSSPRKDLLKRIKTHDIFLNNLIELIPKSIYIGKTDDERESEALNSKYFKHKKKSAVKEQKKEQAKIAKKRKYGVENQETVLETQQKKKNAEDPSPSQPQNNPEVGGTADTPKTNLAAVNGDSIEALRKRLHDKISALHKQRKEIEKSKPGLKPKKDKAGAKVPNERKQQNQSEPQSIQVTTSTKPHQPPPHLPPPLPDLKEDLLFSAIKLPITGKDKKKQKFGEKKNLHKLLEKAEAKRKRLEELKQTEEGKEKAQKMEWGDMLKQASGQKVHDSAQLLKKAIKRKEKRKEASRKKWKEREQTVSRTIADKQEKREANIANRKKKASVQPSAESKQTSRQRPGFEGKKTDFLNKEKIVKTQKQS